MTDIYYYNPGFMFNLGAALGWLGVYAQAPWFAVVSEAFAGCTLYASAADKV